MGLDMYLYKRRYVKNWEHNPKKWDITVKHDGKEVKDTLPVAYVVYDAGYWRKANAIHKWFVDTLAGGEDECQNIYVTRGNLENLRDLCKQVLATAKTKKGKVHNGTRWTPENGREEIYEDGIVITNPEEVAKLLPTQEGFFFGSTDYNEYYLQDIKDTIEICDKALEADDDCEFEYNASW